MNRMPRVAALALAVAVGVSTALVAQSPSHASPNAPDFYTPPSVLPAGNGDLVKQEAMQLGVSFPLAGKQTRLPGNATRIMYRSTDEAGQPVGVTGVYIEPSRKWAGKGPRPLVSLSVGTQGVGDACAPSKTLESLIHTENGKFMVGYEVPSIYGFLREGIAVVVTDYIGLGTTDRVHTYMNRVDQANAVLDAARAALRLPNTSITTKSPVGLYGYSQGGGAAGAAVELAPRHAPELNIKGAYVGGPPADLFEVMKGIDGTLLTGAIPWSINAVAQYRPELAPYVGQLVNEDGLAYLEKSKDQCVVDAILGAGLKKTSAWTRSGNLASADVAKVPALVKAVDDQKIGKLKPHVPVMVLTGTQDDTVAHGQARQLAVDWCAKGTNITYRPVIQLASSRGLMLTHLMPLITHQGESRNWLVDRLEGKSNRSNCSMVRFMP